MNANDALRLCIVIDQLKVEHDRLRLRAGQLRGALFEVLDAIGALGGKHYELEGHGISADRAREIVQIVESNAAQSMAAHDAALLRALAVKWRREGNLSQGAAAWCLEDEADRIEQETGLAG